MDIASRHLVMFLDYISNIWIRLSVMILHSLNKSAIEQDHNARMELLEDLISPESLFSKLQ